MTQPLPDIARDESAPLIFAAGFSALLALLIGVFIALMIARYRASKSGIYTKYVIRGDRPLRRNGARSS
jgi:hypothetical protein